MIAYVFEVHPENLTFKLFIVLELSTREIRHFLKKWPFYGSCYCPFNLERKCFSQVTKTLFVILQCQIV